MKTNISALDIHYLIKELEFLINGKIDKIYNPSKKEIILQFHVPNKGKQQLKIDEKSLFLTEHRFPADTPSGFCMFLRKKLNNSRLRKITQLGFERIVSFEFQAKEENLCLIFELFSKGNIILVKDNKILSASENQQWSTRTIAPKKEYSYPKKEYNLLDLKQSDLKHLFEQTDKESIVKLLAIDLGLGGVYAEEACLLAKIKKDERPSEIEPEKIFKSIQSIISKNIDPRIVYENGLIKDIVPFELEIYKDKKQEKTESFSRSLDSYFSNELIIKENLKQDIQIRKIEKIIEEQQSHIKQLEEQERENKEKAEALYNNYQQVSDILSQFKKILQKHSWKEVQDKLKNHPIIKKVNPKDKSISVRLN